MPYAPVTPAAFKQAKPQFAAVPDQTVQMYLEMAGRLVDETWAEGDYQPAIIAMACHLMTLEGLGTDVESRDVKSGRAQYQSIKSGELTLTRFRSTAGEGASYLDWLNSTACGRYFVFLLRLNRGGPRVISIALPVGASPYAKDHPGPSYGWPGVFG